MSIGKLKKSISKPIKAAKEAVKATASEQLWRNPSAVANQWGDIGQELTSGVRGELSKVPGYSDVEKFLTDHQRELWGTALVAGTAGVGATYLGAGLTAAGIATGLSGAAILGGAALAKELRNSQQEETTSAPPDVNAANDPRLAEQFKRQRRAARMLGRAGTIKSKGASSSLGLGDSILGDSMSLMGA